MRVCALLAIGALMALCQAAPVAAQYSPLGGPSSDYPSSQPANPYGPAPGSGASLEFGSGRFAGSEASQPPLAGSPGFDTWSPPLGDLPAPGPSRRGANEPSPLFEHQAGRTIADVRFIGQETLDVDKILSFVRTRKGRTFDPEMLKADKRSLTSSGLFQDVRIYTRDEPAGLVVTFEVFERPTIRYIKYIGNRGITDRTLTRQCGLEVGESLNTYSIAEARRKIEDYYHERGFPKAIVTTVEGSEPRHRGAVFEISEGPLQNIVAVEFVGNTIASDSRLKTQIQSKPDFIPRLALFRGRVEMNKIEEDVERLTAYYRGLGFFRARVGRELIFDSSQSWLTLRFIIDEGPRYTVRDVAVTGSHRFAQEDLKGQLDLKPGEHFNLARMNRDVNTLRDLYGAQGHVFADIQAEPIFLDEGSELDLVYNVNEGQQFRVGRINVHISGEHPHTRETVVLERLSIRPNDIVDVREVRASERRLKSSQLFENDPASGKTPRIVIRPPDLQDIEVASGGNRRGAVRGQSPDDRGASRASPSGNALPWHR